MHQNFQYITHTVVYYMCLHKCANHKIRLRHDASDFVMHVKLLFFSCIVFSIHLIFHTQSNENVCVFFVCLFVMLFDFHSILNIFHPSQRERLYLFSHASIQAFSVIYCVLIKQISIYSECQIYDWSNKVYCVACVVHTHSHIAHIHV